MRSHGQPGDPTVLWRPTADGIAASNLGRLMRERGFASYEQLHRWSVADRAGYWGSVIERLGVVFRRRPASILDAAGDVRRARWLPGARLNVADSCFRAAREAPAVVSIREGSPRPATISYGGLERLTSRVANGLGALGLGRGDGVALYMPMTLECVAAYLGIVRAGLRVVSIADCFPVAELRRRLEIGCAAAVVTVDRFARAGRSHELYDKVKRAGAPPAIVVASGGDGIRLRKGDRNWDTFIDSADRYESVACEPEEITNVLFSSGTTGTPKAIPWTQLTPVKCAADGHFHHDIRPGDVVAWPTNVGWMMGPWLIYTALMNRATVALYEGSPTGAGFVRFVRDAGVTMLGLVPSLVRAWRESGVAGGADWGSVRVFSSTGEPACAEDYRWLMGLAGHRAPVIEYCGGTEIGGGYITGTVVQPAAPATFTTPALGIDLVLLDEEGRAVEPGEAGEVFLVPPSIGLSSRLLNADHDAVYHDGVPCGPEGETLRRHGDRMVQLRGGFWRAHGRADDTMNLGGIKVASLEIERVVDGCEQVVESAAVGVAPAGGGAERLVLFVVARGDVGAERLKSLAGARVAAELNPLFKIHELILVERLPRTASNKLMRRELRARCRAGA